MESEGVDLLFLTQSADLEYLTGLERNADVVNMASYAPLFAHVDGWQWTPDLIWVNNLKSYGTPDYYVQKLFSVNKGSKVVPITLNNDVIAGQDRLYASAVIDTKENELIIKIVNASDKPVNNIISVQGAKKLASSGILTVLHSGDLNAVNTFDEPKKISPEESKLTIKDKKINLSTAPYSLSVIRVKQS
jgi:alpha-L-arabinofuranosidase